MTSTNDGKDVKSNQISGPKSKTYFIELYKSLEARLSGDCSGEERARLVCESWRRVHSLCQHSAPKTQVHLLNWLQQHTARTILQTEWQSPKSKEYHTWLEEAIDEFIQECQNAISRREGGWSPPWESQLRLRALWYRRTLANPWGHNVLKALLDSRGPQPSDEEVLEWLKLERAVMFLTRLRQLAASKCDDLALLLATTVMDKLRVTTIVVSDLEQAQSRDNTEQPRKDSNFVKILRKEAGFTDDVWNLITDIEFVLLYKGELRSRCIELAKQTPLHNGYQLVKRLHSRLEMSPRERKLWKNAKDAATLVAQVVIARCMVVPQCTGAALVSLYGCASSLVRLLPADKLPPAAAALAAPAATSRHLHTLAEAVHAQCKNDRMPFVCELYVRAITAGMNELERLKIKTEKASEARSMEQTLSTWFSQLGKLLSASKRLDCECILTAFSIHPSAEMYERVKAAPILAPLQSDIQELKEETNSEYGSWANDSRTQTNLVKTSETLNLKKTQKQANVLSTAIFAEGEALGLGAELYQDLAVLISGPRVKTLSWDTDREHLLENCRLYMERTGGGTRALTTELRYLNLDPRCFQHLPEEKDDDSDMYYGIEKGYEHLVEFQEEPEEIWQDAASDDGGKSDSTIMDMPLAAHRRKKTKTKRIKYSSDEESDPLTSEAVKINEKKERPHSKERSKELKEKKEKIQDKIAEKQDTKEREISQESGKPKKKERKERKKNEKDPKPKPMNRPSTSLSRLIGMKVAGYSNLNKSLGSESNINMCITDSDYDSQGKSSIASLNSEGNDPDVLFDGLYSMEEIKSPEKNLNDHIQIMNKNIYKGSTNKCGDYLSNSYRSPCMAPNLNTVNEDVKNSIKKLIEFRRYKDGNEIRTDTNTQLPLSSQSNSISSVSPRYLSGHSNSIPSVNSQTVKATNAPKVFLPKEQITQLNALKDEVNNILQKTAINRDKMFNAAAEALISSNSVLNRPNDHSKKLVPGGNVLKKVEQSVKQMDPRSIHYRQLEKATTKTAQSKPWPYRNQHQELIKHLEAGVSKPLPRKPAESPSQIQFQEFLKSTMASQSGSNIYQNIPQNISNKNPNLAHTKIENKEKIIEQNLHHVSSKSPQKLSRLHKPESPSQQQFHNFLKDLQDSINAGASNDKPETKVSSTHLCSKQMIQKKPDNVPNTFARMSYLKTKQCDYKLKTSFDKILNKCLQGKPTENLQHLQSKGEILISKVDKAPQVLKEKDKTISEKHNKSKVKIEMIERNRNCIQTTPLRIVRNHPTISNMLSSGNQKPVTNVVTTNDLKTNQAKEEKPSTVERSFLSQKDQDDMLSLLRQKSLLNSIKVQPQTHIPKSTLNSINALNNKTPLIVSPDTIPSSSNQNSLRADISEEKTTNEKVVSSSVLKVSSPKLQNSQTKKVRKVKEICKNTKNSSKNSDWESVMDAILATKTPTRVYQTGPNALDIALNKDSFERCYLNNSNVQNQKKINTTVTETNKSTPISTSQTKISSKINTKTVKTAKNPELKSNDKQCASSSKPQTIMKIATAPKLVQKPQKICIETEKFRNPDLTKRDASHRQVKPLPSVIQNRNDPFISGIKNSDYDLLEELMDDDLRQEIGELSDEELYNISLLNTTKYKNLSQTSDPSKKNPVSNKNICIHPQRNADPYENTYKINDLNYKDSSRCNDSKPEVHRKKCTSNINNSEPKLRIISNEVIVAPANVNNSINYYPVINKTVTAIREPSALKNIFHTPKNTNICLSSKTTPVVNNSLNKAAESTVKIDTQIRNVNNNRFNILDPTRVVLTVPQRRTPNVMLISNDYIYDTFSPIRVEDSNVNGNVSNYNNNTYIAVNPAPSVTVYHTTQLTAPVVNPVLVENSIVIPVTDNMSNAVPETSKFISPSTVQKDTKENIISANKSNTEPNVTKELASKSDFKKEDIDKKGKLTDNMYTNRGDSTDFINSSKSQTYKVCTVDKVESPVNYKLIEDIITPDINRTSCKPKLPIDSEDLTNLNILKERSVQKKVPPEDVYVKKNFQINKQEIDKTDFKNLQRERNDSLNERLNKERHDRICQKRLRIQNRQIARPCCHEPIPLAYEPIKSKKLTVPENFTTKICLDKHTIAVSTDIAIPKPVCRRILLRSSNSLPVTKIQKSEIPESKLSGVRKMKAEKRMKSKIKKSSKQYQHDIHKNKMATVANDTCSKEENLNCNIKSQIAAEDVDEKHIVTESNGLPISDQNGRNKLDLHMNVDVEEKIESSIIPVLKKEHSETTDPESKTYEVTKEENNKNKCKNNDPLQSKDNDSTLKTDFTELNRKKQEECLTSKETRRMSNSNQISCGSKDIKSGCDFKKTDNDHQIKEAFKDKIVFEELPNLEGDLSKRYIRIKLPKGSFKATISGKVNINVDSILEDPNIKSMLRENMDSKTKCILNVKQISVQSKDRSSVTKTQIQDISYMTKVGPETINLISDDDDDSSPQSFKTEFGSFKIPSMNRDLFKKHQSKLCQKCEVKIEQNNNLNNVKVDEALTKKDVNVLGFVKDTNHTSNIPKDIVDFIEVDDSSNESVELTSSLHATATKDSLITPKLNEMVNVSKNHVIGDVELNNIVEESRGKNVEIKQSSDICAVRARKILNDYELKECSLKIEKCDKLIKEYEYLKIKNRKCYVNLVRFNVAHYCKKDNCSDLQFRYDSDSSRITEVLKDDEEITSLSDQSLKRIDSMSILNDLSIPYNDVLRVSPSVIENFDINFTIVENNTTFRQTNSSNNLTALNCYADWFVTKLNNVDRIMKNFTLGNFGSFGIENVSVSPDNISTDCDSDKESNTSDVTNFEEDKNTKVDSLVKITLDYLLVKKPCVLETLKTTDVKSKCRNISNSSPLKRKLDDFTDRNKRNKISKLHDEVTLESLHVIEEPIIAQKSLIFFNNQVLSLKNICRSYVNAKMSCLEGKNPEQHIHMFHKKDLINMERNKGNYEHMNNGSNHKYNIFLGGLEPEKTLQPDMEKVVKEIQCTNTNINLHKCHMEQNTNHNSWSTTAIESEHNVTNRDDYIENLRCDTSRIECHILSKHVENVIKPIKISHAKIDECLIENSDENESMESSSPSIISIIVNDVNTETNNHMTLVDNKNKSDERDTILHMKKFISDNFCETPLHCIELQSNTSFKLDKSTIDVTASLYSIQNGENNKYEDSLTEPLPGYSRDKDTSLCDNLSKEVNNDNQLNMNISLLSKNQLYENPRNNINEDKEYVPKPDQDENSRFELFPKSIEVVNCNNRALESHVKDSMNLNINNYEPHSDDNALCHMKKKGGNLTLLNEQMKGNQIEVAVISEVDKDPILNKCVLKSEILSRISKNLKASEDLRRKKTNIISCKLEMDNSINSSQLHKVNDIICNKRQRKINDSINLKIKQNGKGSAVEDVVNLEGHKQHITVDSLKENCCYRTEMPTGINCPSVCKHTLEESEPSLLSSIESPRRLENETDILLEEKGTGTDNKTEFVNNCNTLNLQTSDDNKYDINGSHNNKKSLNIDEKTSNSDIVNKILPEEINYSSSSKELHSSVKNINENIKTVEKKQKSEKAFSDTNITFCKNNKIDTTSSCMSDINETDCFEPKGVCRELEEINTEQIKIKKSNDKPKQKNVTLVYKGDSQLVLEGSIYEDPIVGTCYVFPILNGASMTPEKDSFNNISNENTTHVMKQLKNKILENRFKESEIKDQQDESLNFSILPKITYLKGRSEDDDFNNVTDKKCKRNRKRKMSSSDNHSEKKYRKGKNIDYPKLTITAINDLAYSKEYKRLSDYCNSVTFSYSRPFHIEHIDVGSLLQSWPITGISVDNTEQTDFKNLLFVDEDVYKNPFDPMNQTFAEEISNCNIGDYVSCNINETNFRMGFGEGSDRVIKISEVGDNNSKFSAATLSDVKQVQPFSMSNDRKIKERKIQEPDLCVDQKNIFKRYLTYIQLKEKVRSFFQNTALELNKNHLIDTKEYYKNNITHRFLYELTSPEFIKPSPIECVVQVVQVGQLPVSAAAQNPVTCDPRVTQVTDASPSQCSAENSLQDDSQPPIKTEYTELTTADINFPLVQEYERHIEAQESLKASLNFENIPVETEIKTEIKDEMPDFESDQNECDENNVLQTLVNKHINNVEYSYDSSDNSEILHPTNPEIMYEQEIQSSHDFIPEQKEHNGSLEKTDQIAHAMNAAGITTNSERITNSEETVDVDSQKFCQEPVEDDVPSANSFTKTAINSISLQQALAQILPPPLNQTAQEHNQSTSNSPLTSQVLHIVQGKNTNGNQITLADDAQNSVINNSSTPMLHIVQNKGSHTNSTSNTNSGQNSYGALSLVESGLQSGNNQLLHIVNAGTQKNNSTGQLLKRVNLLTNLTNSQGTNEQKMVQFVCKSADGKSIQLNTPHQRSMVLRLQPIESNIQSSPKQTDRQDSSPISNGNNSTLVKEVGNTQHEIKSRSVYEENYAKFIQNSNKSVPEKSTTLPKFNQAFGKPVFQEDDQKTNDINSDNSHLSPINSSAESPECQGTEEHNAMNIDHIGQISSPPLLLRKSQAQTSQSNLVQQIKQTITPMNLQTMHGGVIYTRQIPVNIGGGQTINLITVPSTELLDNDNLKQQGEVKFINQNDMESPIIKIVPHGQNNSSADGTAEESNNNIGVTNENGQSTPTQHQPVLTQMRIKLPMLSKAPQMVSGARVVRPSFFQIQRNVIGGANQPVYQQLVLTAAPPLSQHIRLPQTQTNRQVKVTSEGQSSSETQMSTSTLEQLREFDMVLEQVKERSTVQPNHIPANTFVKLHGSSSDATDCSSVTSTVTESTQQVLYSIGNNQSLNVAYVNRKPNTTFVRSPDSSGIIDSPSSSTHIQIPHTVTSESTSNDVSTQPSQPKAAKVGSKSKSRPKSSSTAMKINTVPPKTSTQKPLEDEQTTQRILYILAEYKEQVENSPDKDKPAPRRRSNPPSNPGSSKRKKSSSGSRRHGMRDMSPILGEDTCRTMGSEDSSCGTSQGDCNESCMDSHSPQDSPRKVARKLTFDNEATTPTQARPQPQRNVIVADGQTIAVARGTSGKPTTAVLMPANYLLPVSMVKGGQQIAIVTNRGPKILTVGGEGGTTNALLLQRLIGPAGLKPVLARPGVRHVRLPTAALHNLHAFNLATATVQPPDSTATPAAGSTPPELIETRVTSSPWTERDSQEVKPERGSSPEDTEPWNLPTSADPNDYSYEETVRTENMDRTVLDAIPDRYSPDMEAQRIFDKMFDVDSKRSYIIDSQDDTSRCAYDIDASDCGDKPYQVVQRRDGSRHHRFAHVAHAAAMRHKYAILEHELRLQKSLSEECEDLGVDSPSASELFPEAELLFGNSPAHEAHQHSHTPQPTVHNQCGIPQPDIDDQIATDHLIQNDVDDQQDLGVTLGLDEGIVTVSEDGMQATITLDQEEFARSHPNTTFHSEPTDEGEIQPFTIAGLKGRHITSTIFHATRAPATVLVSAPPTVISHGEALRDDVIKYDNILNDTRELHLTHTASAIVHSTGNTTQVIRRVCWDEKRDSRWMDEPDGLIAGDDAKMIAEDSRDETLESMTGDVDDGNSTPERHAELYWESNSASERSESRRPLDFSSDSEKCCKSPYEETNSTDSSGVGTHMRLDSVIKDARGIELSGSADGSSADDTHPPIRTYPAKRMYSLEGMERSMTGKTRAGERSPDILEVRRRASGRGVVKRGCHCCNGSPAPPRPKKSRQRKPNMDYPTH